MAVDSANDTEKFASLTDLAYQRIEEEVKMCALTWQHLLGGAVAR